LLSDLRFNCRVIEAILALQVWEIITRYLQSPSGR
jgi:hypothetical protein